MRIHISTPSLKQLFKQRDINERVVYLPDDLMLGPLGNIGLKDVQAERLNWWGRICSEGDRQFCIDLLDESFESFNDSIHEITDQDSLLFWVGDNPTEYTGMMCLLAYLPDSIPVSIIKSSMAYYKRYGGFKPLSTGEIPPEKLLSLLDDPKPLSSRVREGYVKNWNQLLADNGILRIRKNGRIETVPEEYFDERIISLARKISRQQTYLKNGGYLPALRLVGEVTGRSKQKIMDTFIEWRIRCLIQQGHLAYEGSLTSARLYKIKPI